MGRGLRSGKEFRAYSLSPGQPIISQFDLQNALDAYEDPETPDALDYEVDLEGELSELSDLESEDSCESFEVEPPLPSSLPPFVPAEEKNSSESEEEPSEEIGLGQGKRARRRRKTLANRKKRRIAQEEARSQFQTGLKEIARRRAAESQALSPGNDFLTEDLPAPLNPTDLGGITHQIPVPNGGDYRAITQWVLPSLGNTLPLVPGVLVRYYPSW
ncbi:hypothetical protein F5880DRAFT_1734109 [Lentinula raphanica]|nr:hypothetical protein F5880DRAFT_1734109 [Lentinula raphanica]